MGRLHCLRCKEEVEADTFDEATAIIDHAAKSIKCNGKDENLRWNDEPVVGTVSLLVDIPVAKATTTKKKVSSKKSD